jgi:hypothetical protein
MNLNEKLGLFAFCAWLKFRKKCEKERATKKRISSRHTDYLWYMLAYSYVCDIIFQIHLHCTCVYMKLKLQQWTSSRVVFCSFFCLIVNDGMNELFLLFTFVLTNLLYLFNCTQFWVLCLTVFPHTDIDILALKTVTAHSLYLIDTALSSKSKLTHMQSSRKKIIVATSYKHTTQH